MDLGLTGKNVVVTGASKGIGKAIAVAFVAEGANVGICARGREDLESASGDVERAGPGAVFAMPADVIDGEQARGFVDATAQHLGGIDVLVNNAGGVDKFAGFDELTDEHWRWSFDANFFSAVTVTRAALPYLRAAGGGRIVNISSESAAQPDGFMDHYNTAKAALSTLTKTLSKELADDGILVNTVSPAFTMTPLVHGILSGIADEQGASFEQVQADYLAGDRRNIVLRRPGRPEETAAAVVFLASARASFITGANLRVDGGSVASV